MFPGLSRPPANSGDPYRPVIPTQVTLPNGQTYQFKYNRYGELARVILPTGGAFEYDWASGYPNSAGGEYVDPLNQLESNIHRRLSARRTYKSGTTLEGTESYSFTVAGP